MLYRSCFQVIMHASISYFFCVACWLQQCTTIPGESCATFELSSLTDLKLYGRENVTVNITFNIKDWSCKALDNFKILVSKYDKRHKIYEHVCGIQHTGRVCTSPTSGLCLCLSPNKYLFTKTLHRSDNTLWKWSTDDNSVNDTTIHFNVTYPANVKSLLIDGVKDQYYENIPITVPIVCTWENGNPPTTLRLLDAHGNEIANSSKSGSLTRNISIDSRCERDVFRCEADDSYQNASFIFLSECPPTLDNSSWKNISTSAGFSFNATFSLLLNDVHITRCMVHEIFSNTSYHCRIQNISSGFLFSNTIEKSKKTYLVTDPSEDKCSCSVHGTPPYLCLELVFSRVAESDSGLWHLSVSNENGIGFATIYIQVSEGLVLNRPPPMKLEWIVTGIACGVTLMLILIFVRQHLKDQPWDPSQDTSRVQMDSVYHEIYDQTMSSAADINKGVVTIRV